MEHLIHADNTIIWTDVRGENRNGAVMLCNGGPGSCDYLQPVSEMLEDGYQVIRFEQRGCGRSGADGRYDIPTTLGDLERIREFYKIDKWIVGGHSWGANLALMYALAYPNRTQAVLYLAGNGFQRNREWSEAYHKNRDRYGEALPPMQFEGSDAVNRAGNASYQGYIQQPTLWRDLSQLEMRVLFLCAEQDIRPAWPVEQLYHLIPNGELAVVHNAGHYLWLQQYHEVKKHLRRFLNLSDEPEGVLA